MSYGYHECADVRILNSKDFEVSLSFRLILFSSESPGVDRLEFTAGMLESFGNWLFVCTTSYIYTILGTNGTTGKTVGALFSALFAHLRHSRLSGHGIVVIS